MKIKKVKNYQEYIREQDPPTRDYNMSFVKYEDVEKYISKGDLILDIGCKAGLLVRELYYKGFDSYGVDIGDGCLEKWKEYPLDIRVRFKKLDFIQDEYKGTFDFIVMSHVLEHFYDPDVAMNKVYKMLRDNGKVYCTFPINDSYGAHYFSFEKESEIVPWFNKFGFFVRVEEINKKGEYPIYTLILKK